MTQARWDSDGKIAYFSYCVDRRDRDPTLHFPEWEFLSVDERHAWKEAVRAVRTVDSLKAQGYGEGIDPPLDETKEGHGEANG